LRHQSVIGHRDHTAARVPFGLTKRVKLLEIHPVDAGFLAQFANRRVVEGFVVAHETPGKRVTIFERLRAAPDQQNVRKMYKLQRRAEAFG